MSIELLPAQVTLIVLVCSVVVQLLKLWVATTGKALHRIPVTIIMMVLSFGFAVLFASPVLPALPVLTGLDPVAVVSACLVYAAELITVLAALTGLAQVIYNLFLENVYVKLGLDSDVVQAKALEAKNGA